jgi:hypothetical protein
LRDKQSLQVRHSAALQELDKYKILVESVEDYAIFMMDSNGYILTWNKGAEKNKGWKAEEIIGEHFSKFYPQADKDAHKPERELALAKKWGQVEDEGWRLRKDGSKFWANVLITAIFDSEGELLGFAKVTRDLTERKKQEDALRRINQQLKQQQRQLEKLNASKDEFISLASHQLRTPATVIKQLLGMLLEGMQGELPANIEATLQRAYDSNERQINIVNSLLKVAQLDAGYVTLKKDQTDLISVLRSAYNDMSETFSKKQQHAALRVPKAGEVMVAADDDYLRMAIENLLDNASKYTAAGGTIELGLKVWKNHAVITVKDNGVGIDENDMKLLFNKFIRIPNPVSQKVGGSGLGLYWAHKVVELHNGRIDVLSELNKGTTFQVALPLERIGENA